jgi:4'-phosphopantetheinyl transferase
VTDVDLWQFDVSAFGSKMLARARDALGSDLPTPAAAGRDLDDLALVRRGVLKLLLAERLGVNAATLSLETSPLGKPSLRGGPSFSTSRSGDRFVIAICDKQDMLLGVDLEVELDEAKAQRLKTVSLHPAELARVVAGGAEDLRHEVLRIWTLKEAWAKALGVGLHADFRRTRLTSLGDGLFRAEGPAADDRVWQGVSKRDLSSGTVISVAVEHRGRDLTLKLRDFQCVDRVSAQ